MRHSDATNKLYCILEEMVRCAETGNMPRVQQLNRTYEALNPKQLYATMDEAAASDYDNCRQSCTLIGTFLMPDTPQAVRDAKNRFARIPRPRTP